MTAYSKALRSKLGLKLEKAEKKQNALGESNESITRRRNMVQDIAKKYRPAK